MLNVAVRRESDKATPLDRRPDSVTLMENVCSGLFASSMPRYPQLLSGAALASSNVRSQLRGVRVNECCQGAPVPDGKDYLICD